MLKLIKKALTFIFTLYVKKTVKKHGINVKANFFTRLTPKTILGNNTNFNGLTIRGEGEVIIGDNFHSGKDILLINSYHKYDNANAIPYDSKETISKSITIEDNVWLGDRVTILGGVTIGEGAIIQAGAVVVKDIPKFGIAGGNPATTFKYRNIDSYETLKKNKKFW